MINNTLLLLVLRRFGKPTKTVHYRHLLIWSVYLESFHIPKNLWHSKSFLLSHHHSTSALVSEILTNNQAYFSFSKNSVFDRKLKNHNCTQSSTSFTAFCILFSTNKTFHPLFQRAPSSAYNDPPIPLSTLWKTSLIIKLKRIGLLTFPWGVPFSIGIIWEKAVPTLIVMILAHI